MSNGAFLQLATRLARYTGNQTYTDWANRIYSWTENIGLIGSGYHVFDGTDDTINCTQINHIEWTYNAGLYIYSAAIMYNMTAGTDVGGMWQTRLTGLIQTAGKSAKSPPCAQHAKLSCIQALPSSLPTLMHPESCMKLPAKEPPRAQ